MNRKILLVEDMTIVAMVESETIKSYGYEVVTASSGEDAIDAVKADLSIGLVLMDINLGEGIDGVEAAKLILEIRDLPVIFLTSHSQREMVEKVRGITRYAYVVKESSDFVLLPSIEMAFELFDAHRNAEKKSEERTEELKHTNALLQAEITERKGTQEALQKSEERYRNLFESSRDAIMILEPPWWKFTAGNQSAIDMFHAKNNEEFISFEPWQLSPEHQPDGCHSGDKSKEKIEKALHEGSCFFEWTHQRISGEEFSAIVLLSRVEQDGTVFLMATVRDITQQKKAEETVLFLQKQNELILASAGEGILGLNREGRITFINPAASRMFGFDRSELTNCYLHSLTHHTKTDGSPYPAEECQVYGAFKDGVIHHVDTEVFWRKDGSCFPIDYTSSPIRDDRDEIAGAVVVFKDISERKMIEDQLRHAQKMESIGQLASGIAHELNTPIQFIGNNLSFLLTAFNDLDQFLHRCEEGILAIKAGTPVDDMIRTLKAAAEETDRDYLEEEIPGAIEQALEGIKRVSGIVYAMKEFSHPGESEKSLVDINHAIENAIIIARNEWKPVAEMVTDLDPAMPLIACLPGELNQVFLNIIINAAHAIGSNTEKRGIITIRTIAMESQAEICISDTGTGIPENIRSRIFDPFFTTKEVGKGTGQGMALAHSVIAGRHKGTLRFESEMGKGTTFIIKLPLY